MAFLPQDEQNQNAPQGSTTNNPQGGAGLPPQGAGGSVGAATGGAKAGSSPSAGTSTQFGSSASKLGDYLSANAPQIQNQANNIVGGLNTQYGQVNQDITNAANQFQSQVQGGYNAPNQDVVNQAKNDTVGFAQDPNQVKAFQGQYNNQYKGPQNFEGTDQYGNIQNEVNNAVQNASLMQSPAGLQSYLAGTQKNPTRASTTLDQLLLSGNPESQQKINAAAKQFSGLGDTFGQATSGANQSVQAAQKAAQDSQAYARGQFDPYAQQFGTDLNTQLTNANQNRDLYNQQVTANMPKAQDAKAQLLAAQQAALQGVRGTVNNNGSPALGDKISGLVDPASYLNKLAPYLSGQPITQPGTLGSVATKDQYAKDSALEQLLGDSYNQNLNPNEISQAGSYSVPTLPGGVPDISGEKQYIGDIGSLYGNPGIYNVNMPGGWQNADPTQLAQSALNMRPGQGYNADPATMAALQRIIANQYAGR